MQYSPLHYDRWYIFQGIDESTHPFHKICQKNYLMVANNTIFWFQVDSIFIT